MPIFVRYPLAVFAGTALGEVFSISAALALDAAFGAGATGGRWPLTIPNVILVCIKGLMSGYIAGWISTRRGKLLGGLTSFSVTFTFIVVSIATNRDLTPFFDAHYDTKPVLWSWVALLPAIFGGHLGVKHGSKGPSYLATGVGLVGMYCFYFGTTALHVYTIILAYRISGLFAATMTFMTPPLAELYWFVAFWRGTGEFVNWYSIYLFLLFGFFVFNGLLLGGAAFLEKRRTAD